MSSTTHRHSAWSMTHLAMIALPKVLLYRSASSRTCKKTSGGDHLGAVGR